MSSPPPRPDDGEPGRALLPPALTLALTLGLVAGCVDVTVSTDGGLDDDEPPEAGWVTAAAGLSHTCGLAASGGVFCWGSDGRGQLGLGAGFPDDSASDVGDCAEPCLLRPRPVAGPLAAFDTVVSGGVHSCALTGSGRAYCWGANDRGQVGDSTLADRPAPTPVAGDLTFASLSAGREHTCGITRLDRHLYCWGDNFWGQLGRGSRSTAPARVPLFVLRQTRAVDAGSDHTCALTGEERVLLCWGRNHRGQLGLGYISNIPETSPVPVLTTAATVSAGMHHTCALSTSEGTARCWGWNDEGAVGIGRESGYETDPRTVSRELAYAEISAGGGHTCAVGTGGGLLCWGENLRGQLGIGTAGGFSVVPEPAASRRRFVTVSAGAGEPVEPADPSADDLDGTRSSSHACAVSDGGVLLCWGSNAHGELGDGTRADRSSPVPVPDPGG